MVDGVVLDGETIFSSSSRLHLNTNLSMVRLGKVVIKMLVNETSQIYSELDMVILHNASN
jgi:hypothetical protein